MKKAFKGILIFAILMVGLLPIGASANSATFFDVDNDVSYLIKLHSKTAEIGGDISYTVTIYNRSVYRNTIFYGSDSLGNEFDFLDDDRLSLQPGQSISFDIKGSVPEYCDWYFENGKAYVDITISYCFDSGRETMEPTTYANAVNDYPQTVELTNLRDGRDMIDLNIHGNFNEMYFMDDGYNLKYKLNSSKTNVWGFTILPVTISNISQETVEDVTVFSTLLGDYNHQVSLQLGESVFEVVSDSVQIESGKPRPDVSSASAKLMFIKGGEYFGVQASAMCRNVFIDQAPELSVKAVALKGDLKSSNIGMENYKVTIKNTSKNALQNFYVMFHTEYSEEKKQSQYKTHHIYQLEVNEAADFYVEMMDDGYILFEAGGMFFGDQMESGTYLYNLKTGKLSVRAYYPGMYYFDFDEEAVARFVVESIGGDLPSIFETYVAKLAVEKEAEEKPSPTSEQSTLSSAATPEPSATIIVAPPGDLNQLVVKKRFFTWQMALKTFFVLILATGLISYAIYANRKSEEELKAEKQDKK